MKRIVGSLMAWGAGLLLLGASVAPAAAQVPVTSCGTLSGNTSYILTADLNPGTAGDCLLISGNGSTINLNGHRISGIGTDNTDGKGIAGVKDAFGVRTFPNNVTVKGPGIIHDFGGCISLGRHTLVESVLAYNCGAAGIETGGQSKCVQCRVHNSRVSEPPGSAWGIIMGDGCLLESSIVLSSDNGAWVGSDCKVWDLVVGSETFPIIKTGVKVGAGTSVARTVVSHCHDCPAIDYTGCSTPANANGAPRACQDSSNSVYVTAGQATIADAVTTALGGEVVTDCATNHNGVRYEGTKGQCTNDNATPPL